MGYLAIAIVIGFVALLHKIIDSSEEKNRAEIEDIHEKMYEVVDKYYAGKPNYAREQKAEIDDFIHGYWDSMGKEYSTKRINEVTTAKERKNRSKPTFDEGFEQKRALLLDALDEAYEKAFPFTEEELMPYIKVTKEEALDRSARFYSEKLGISYDKAYKHLEEQLS